MECGIQTKFGKAMIGRNGYYQIVTDEKGNDKKYLHRLVFEDFYNIKLPSDIIIHHDDGNKLNNEIWNLIPMTQTEHMALHYNEGLRQRLSEINFDKDLSEETKQKMSKSRNTSGFFRVCKRNDKSCKQGFLWVYQYYDEKRKGQKSLRSVNLLKLKQKVLDNGFEWLIINEDNARATCDEFGYDYSIINT
jgi:hypothetical protein